MKGRLTTLLASLFLIYGSLVLFFNWYEYEVTYHPSTAVHQDISHLDLEEHVISHGEENLHLVYKEQNRDKVILFCHGNAGNITTNLSNLEYLDYTGYSYVMFDYPGYGRSTGRPSEQALYESAQTVYDFLIKEKNYRPDQIILDGQSLGGAVAIDLATKNPVQSVITAATFIDSFAIARQILPWLPPQPFISKKFDNLSKIDQINAPILFIHGEADTTIPYEHSDQLYQAALEHKERVIIPNFDHEQQLPFSGPESDQITAFIERAW